jgi:hypothetical protein
VLPAGTNTLGTAAFTASTAYDASGAAAARQANLSLLAGTYSDGKMCTYTASGTLLNCNTTIPTNYTISTGLTNTSGTVTVAYGTTSTTATVGNDSRVTGAAQNIANGSVTLTTSTVTNSGVIASATCQSLGTHQTATGITYADVIDWTIAGSTSGYTDPTTLASGLLASAMLTFIPYSDAAGYLQIKVCNLTGSSITLPASAGPIVVWKVRR